MPSRDGRWAGPLSSHALSLPDRRQARSPSRCASQSSSRSSQSASTPWCGPAWRRVNIFHVVLKLGHACCSPRARLGGKGAAPATYCTATLSFPPPLSQRRMPSRAPLNLPLGWRGPASVAPASRHRPARRPSSPDTRLSPASRPPPHCLIPPLWRPPSSAGARATMVTGDHPLTASGPHPHADLFRARAPPHCAQGPRRRACHAADRRAVGQACDRDDGVGLRPTLVHRQVQRHTERPGGLCGCGVLASCPSARPMWRGCCSPAAPGSRHGPTGSSTLQTTFPQGRLQLPGRAHHWPGVPGAGHRLQPRSQSGAYRYSAACRCSANGTHHTAHQAAWRWVQLRA
jgi:hypothetical protein